MNYRHQFFQITQVPTTCQQKRRACGARILDGRGGGAGGPPPSCGGRAEGRPYNGKPKLIENPANTLKFQECRTYGAGHYCSLLTQGLRPGLAYAAPPALVRRVMRDLAAALSKSVI